MIIRGWKTSGFRAVNMRKWRVPFSEGMRHGGHVTTRFDTWFRTPGGPPSVTHHIVKRRYRDKRPRGGWCTPRGVVFPQPPYHAHLWTLQTCFNFFLTNGKCAVLSETKSLSLSLSLSLFPSLRFIWDVKIDLKIEESSVENCVNKSVIEFRDGFLVGEKNFHKIPRGFCREILYWKGWME